MTRVAVQVGAAWLRVAAEGRVVAELPATRTSLTTVLDGLFDGPPDELVVVHRAGARSSGARSSGARSSGAGPPEPCTGRAVAVVPAATAALAEHAAATGAMPAAAVVVDVGHGRTEISHVDAGLVVGVRCVAVGGAHLDAAAAGVLARAGAAASPAEVRRVREALSLLPAVRVGTPAITAADLCAALRPPLADVVDAVCAVVGGTGPGARPPVLLIGGVARTPLLAELLDAAGVDDVHVADRPDRAAVLGALRLPAGATTPDPAPAGFGRPAAARAGSWLPPVRPARHRVVRGVLGAVAALAVAAGLLAAGTALPEPAPSAPSATAGELVQYGYAVRLPAGWAHTGGLPERRRSLLTPAAAPGGSDLISVERTPLGYDADAEPRRARAELHAAFVAAAATGAPLSGFDEGTRYAGRLVVAYREAGTATTGDVDWYVVLDGDAQLSVGCQHTSTGAAAVEAACATVVGSLRRTG